MEKDEEPLQSFRSENKNKDKYKFCLWEILYFVFLLVFIFMWFLTLNNNFENSQLHILYPGFYVFMEKVCVTTMTMFCMDHTLDEEDVLMIFDELEVQNSPLGISFLRRWLLHKIL